MRTAISVYKRQFDATIPSTNDKGKALPKEKRISLAKDTYVFLPNEQNRDRALKELQVYFSLLTNHLGLKEGPNGEERTLYSLRHTCIMYRLMYGQGIDLLTLARNARTSPEMIDRFYARHLHGEMNLELIQSKRSKIMSKNSIKS
jgi:cupin superfamily acireductone dioxygenase involved in methionine salvage